MQQRNCYYFAGVGLYESVSKHNSINSVVMWHPFCYGNADVFIHKTIKLRASSNGEKLSRLARKTFRLAK